MDLTEQEAIARLKQGDIGGLEFLVRRHQTEAMRAVYLITRNQAGAEDIVQAAFLRAYERIEQFDSHRSFRPWFLRSVINDAFKSTAWEGRQVSLEAVLEEAEAALTDRLNDSAPGPADLAEVSDTRQRVWLALGQLSPLQRAAIVQRYYLGLSENDMAAAADCAPGTIKWRLHTARNRLRALLRPLDL
ncbi:MAG: RNA polymerase sigma factor [Chloroflexota bacterium]